MTDQVLWGISGAVLVLLTVARIAFGLGQASERIDGLVRDAHTEDARDAAVMATADEAANDLGPDELWENR